MARREYESGQPTKLLNPLNIGGNTFTITLTGTLLTGWPDGAEGYNFWVTVDAGTPQEERILCASRSGSVVTVADGGRGADGTTESNHAAGADIWPSWSATDADEANEHINLTTGIHGYTATAAEINILDGATLTTTELNYVDGVTSPIQTQINAVSSSVSSNTPVGTIVMYGGTIAPTGWLLCNGQATTNPSALRDLIGANVPDLMGRTPVGYGAGSGLTARNTIGAKFGAETHALSVNEMPSHDHPFDAGDGLGLTNRTHFMDRNASHGHGLNNNGAHQHAINTAIEIAGSLDNSTAINNLINAKTTGLNYLVTNAGEGGHDHGGVAGTDTNHRHTIQGQGGGAAHNNIQPSTVVNFIIKT
jgi:microcystin-dependent protein